MEESLESLNSPESLENGRILLQLSLSGSSRESLESPISQTEIYPVQIWSLAVLQESSSGPPAPVLDQISGPMGARFLTSTGLQFATPIENAQLLPAPAPDKN